MQHPVINMMKNSAVLGAACPGSYADALLGAHRGFALELAASTAGHASSYGERFVPVAVELADGKDGTAVFADQKLRGGNGMRLRDVRHVQVSEQRWCVLRGTSPIAPTTPMAATKRGMSGPFPWRHPVN